MLYTRKQVNRMIEEYKDYWFNEGQKEGYEEGYEDGCKKGMVAAMTLTRKGVVYTDYGLFKFTDGKIMPALSKEFAERINVKKGE